MDIPAGLTNAAMWAIVVGFLQPIVLQFILQSKWSARVQALAAFGFSVITGGLTAYFTGAFENVGSLVTVILLVAVASISSYQGFWKKVTPDLKDATSIAKADPQVVAVAPSGEVKTEAVDTTPVGRHAAPDTAENDVVTRDV